MPVVNYNAFFGFVSSSAGLLNLALLLDCIKNELVPAIPYTKEFVDERINFVTRPLKITIKNALWLELLKAVIITHLLLKIIKCTENLLFLAIVLICRLQVVVLRLLQI